MCSEAFNFDPVKANNILTIYWIAFAVGRGSGIILTRYITSWLFVIIGCVGSIIGVAGIIGTDYLISEDASEAAREASLITNTVIFGFFVSVSLKIILAHQRHLGINRILVHLWLCGEFFKWIHKYEFIVHLFDPSWNVYWGLYTANNYRNASKGQESTHYRWIMIGQKFDWSVRWFRVKDEPVWMNWMVFICSWGALLFEFLIWRQVL